MDSRYQHISQHRHRVTSVIAGGALLAAVAATGLASSPAEAQAAPAPVAQRRDVVLGLLGVVTAPAITGDPQVGSTLSAQGPLWSLLNVTTSVTWLRNGAAIPGATGYTYTLTAADAGATIQLQAVGAVLGLLPVTAYSNALVVGVPAVPTPTPTPTPTTPTPTTPTPTTPTPTAPTPTTPAPTTPAPTDPGTPAPTTPTPTTPTPTTPTGPATDVLRAVTVPGLPDTGLVGGLLAVLDPVWNLPGVTTTFQWLRDGAAIDGADGQVYVPVLADAGHLLSVEISGQLLGLSLVSVHTDGIEIAAIDTDQEQVEPLGDVTVTGSRRIGTTLTAVSPDWDEDGATASYQWMRDETPIAHATSATYDLAPADWGHQVSVRVTGHVAGMLDSTIASDPVTPELGAAIRPTTKPSVAGQPKVGQVLTAAGGTWTDATGTEDPGFTYQWNRDGVAIAGAVAPTYQLTTDDAGRTVGVTVTAIRPGYRPGVFSTARATIAKQRSTTTLALSAKQVRAGRSVPVRATVAVPGLTAPGGTVTVYDRNRPVRTVDLGSSGSVKVVLRKVRRGAHRIKAVYSGTVGVRPSASPVVRIKVRRR